MNKQQAYEIASRVLEEKRSAPIGDLVGLIGAKEKSTVAGPEGQTYFVEVEFEQLSNSPGVRITAVVDLGNSHKLERIEDSIEIRTD